MRKKKKETRVNSRLRDWVLVGCWGCQQVWGHRKRRMESRNQFALALPQIEKCYLQLSKSFLA